MKQHITKEQFNSLPEKQIDIWNKWLINKTDWSPSKKIGKDGKVYLETAEVDFNIGRMIEFLNTFVDKSGYGEWVKFGIFENNGWVVFRSPHKDCTEIYTGVEIELCDCLWKAIKEVLKDDN